MSCKPKQDVDLEGASEPVLLGWMASQASHPQAARKAWEVLYRRHVRYILAVVSRAFGAILGPDLVSDVASETFRKAFEWTGRNPDSERVKARFDSEDPDLARRRVLAWLGSIARRLVQDQLRDRCLQGNPITIASAEAPEEVEQEDDDRESPTPTPLQVILSTLSANEEVALRVSLPWYDAEQQKFMMPRGEAAAIADSLDTTPAALRQRRHRAIRRLRSTLLEAGWHPEAMGGKQ